MASSGIAASVGSGVGRAGAALWRDTEGAAALEYSLVGMPFLALLTGVLYLMLNYLAQQGLETASESASRMLLTGQAQSATVTHPGVIDLGMTASDFKNAICNGETATDSSGNPITFPKALPPFLTCGNLTVNVGVIPAYTKANLGSLVSGYAPLTSAGGQGNIVVLQLIYNWQSFSGLMGSKFNGNLVATQVFTTESYSCSAAQLAQQAAQTAAKQAVTPC